MGVSFLEDPNKPGRMVRALQEMGIEPLQFRLDAKRPDLTKLDALLGLLSAEANFFAIQAKQLSLAQAAGSSVEQMVAQIREGPDAMKKKISGVQEVANDNNAASKEKDKEEEEEELSLVAKYRLTASQDGASLPEEFVCPITGELMEDPVVASDGQSYERSAIVA